MSTNLNPEQKFITGRTDRKALAAFVNSLYDKEIFSKDDPKLTDALCKKLALCFGEWQIGLLDAYVDDGRCEDTFETLTCVTEQIDKILEPIISDV